MIDADYTPLDEMRKPFTNAAEDLGKSRDVRDFLIAETDDGVATVQEIRGNQAIGIGRNRLVRILDNCDWFVGAVVDGAEAIQITQAGHVALCEDEDREYEAIAGERFAAESTEVQAHGD